MIFCKDFLFVHVPKTGGMSVTRWLLNNYMGELFLSVPKNAFDHARNSLAFDDIAPRLTLVEGIRHEKLSDAQAVTAAHGYALEDFETIVGIIRHPYDLERSYFHHLQRPKTIALRKNNNDPSMAAAATVDFLEFVETCGFYGKNPSDVEEYFTIDGETPANMKMVRMENFVDELDSVFGPYLADRFPLGHQNRSAPQENRIGGLPTVPSEFVEPLRGKHPFLSRIYDL